MGVTINFNCMSCAELAKMDFTEEREQVQCMSRQVLSQLPLCQSPIEELFLRAIAEEIVGLNPKCQHVQVLATIRSQFPVSEWHVDFAIPSLKIAIECEGHAWHSSKCQHTHDCIRQRGIVQAGWYVIRFSGAEIVYYPWDCVFDLKVLIHTHLALGSYAHVPTTQ